MQYVLAHKVFVCVCVGGGGGGGRGRGEGGGGGEAGDALVYTHVFLPNMSHYPVEVGTIFHRGF